ncbi:MAG: ribonuclease HII [Alphaproteobacteria bacterium]|nr:ribonuclease HII [Alphaproteobacteria bacterium]
MRGAPVAGIDEVGRGPWAGPVLACAVVLHREIDGVADSKTLAKLKRETLAARLEAKGVADWALGVASVAEIDRLNIRQATFLAMRRALARLAVRPVRALVDGRDAPDLGVPTGAVRGGDGKIAAIAAASIIAKVHRDALMAKLAGRHPHYGWSTNVGYGTPEHRAGLDRFGVTAHHRRSFAPVRERLAGGRSLRA